ncbi:MAG: glycosyltransferase [Planctomycetia bacterium]|nr:glycosyltransferase [Planctomycetia bacterium]
MTRIVETRRPDCSLIVNTFEKPRHLALVLESIAAQAHVDGRIEVIVADDGSRDETAAVVAEFSATARVPVRFTSEPHAGFRLARVRNRGARLARGEYLLFLDGDCILPRDHVATYLTRRRPGLALLGYCARLPEEASSGLSPETLAETDLDALVPASERRLLRRRHRKAWWHSTFRHPTKPRLAGGNCGIWRADFERVNGFDERFVGWGQEDDDLGLRLRAAGVKLESILDDTWSLHVWHPTDPTATKRWRDGPNVGYFLRRGRLTRCRHGIVERPIEAVRWGLPDAADDGPLARALAGMIPETARAAPTGPCEIEIVTRPGGSRFTRRAECRLVIAEPGAVVEPSLRRRAHRVARVHPADVEGLLAQAG